MNQINKKGRRLTSGFTQAGVYARRQFCADLEVYRPPEPLWNPRLREAATTLEAMRGQRSAIGKRKKTEKTDKKKIMKLTDKKRKISNFALCRKNIEKDK